MKLGMFEMLNSEPNNDQITDRGYGRSRFDDGDGNLFQRKSDIERESKVYNCEWNPKAVKDYSKEEVAKPPSLR